MALRAQSPTMEGFTTHTHVHTHVHSLFHRDLMFVFVRLSVGAHRDGTTWNNLCAPQLIPASLAEKPSSVQRKQKTNR